MQLQQHFRNLFGVDALPALDELLFGSYELQRDPRSKLFEIVSTDRELEQSQEIDGLGLFRVKGEGEIAAKDQFNQAYSKNFAQSTYALSFGLTKEMMADDRWSLVSKMIKALGKSAKETEIVLAMNVFNNAFGSEKSADGKAIIASDHPSQVGDQSNTLSAAADLSTTSLKEAEKIFRKTKDSRGLQIDIMPRVLLVSEADRHNAAEIVKSPYLANTANNNINSIGMDGGLEVISDPRLSDDDAWFLLADAGVHGLKIYERQKLQTRTHEDNLAGVLYYVADFRQALGCDAWRGIVGTQGA